MVVSVVFSPPMEVSWLMAVSVRAFQWTLDSIFEPVTCMHRVNVCLWCPLCANPSININHNVFYGTFSFPGIPRLPARSQRGTKDDEGRVTRN